MKSDPADSCARGARGSETARSTRAIGVSRIALPQQSIWEEAYAPKMPAVTYDEIWDITCNDNLSLRERMGKLEGCARRIITETLNGMPSIRNQRDDIDYRLIVIL